MGWEVEGDVVGWEGEGDDVGLEVRVVRSGWKVAW